MLKGEAKGWALIIFGPTLLGVLATGVYVAFFMKMTADCAAARREGAPVPEPRT